jgi:hypothetical protein
MYIFAKTQLTRSRPRIYVSIRHVMRSIGLHPYSLSLSQRSIASEALAGFAFSLALGLAVAFSFSFLKGLMLQDQHRNRIVRKSGVDGFQGSRYSLLIGTNNTRLRDILIVVRVRIWVIFSKRLSLLGSGASRCRANTVRLG